MSGYIGIMEKEMEATIVYCGYIGITDNKMETRLVLSIVVVMTACRILPGTNLEFPLRCF